MIKKYLKTALVLTIICGVAALVLALINGLTAPVIMENEKAKEKQALMFVSNSKEIGAYHEVESDAYVTGYYDLVGGGYLVKLTTNGYGGPITLLANYDVDGVLQNATVLNDSETPGLGKKAEKPEYMQKFIGKGNNMPTKKDQLSEVDAQAVSGASMTFGGISKALLGGSMFVGGLK